LSTRIEEGGIERCGKRIGFSGVGDLREQKFIPEPIRMISASEQNQEAPHFRIGVDDYAVSDRYIRDERAVKLAAIAIRARVNGIENFYMQNGSLRQDAKGICVRMAKTSLQVKRESRSRGIAEGFDSGTRNLSGSGDCKNT
jgi:hypothetical protein